MIWLSLMADSEYKSFTNFFSEDGYRRSARDHLLGAVIDFKILNCEPVAGIGYEYARLAPETLIIWSNTDESL